MSRTLWALMVVLCAVPVVTAQTVGDDFDDDAVDAATWGTDDVGGHGVLNEINQRLEYTVGSPTAEDSVDRTWLAGVGPYDASWEVQIDLFDGTTPTQNDQVSSFGIDVSSTRDPEDEFYAELYASHLFAPPLRTGFHAELLVDGAVVGPGSDSGDLGKAAKSGYRFRDKSLGADGILLLLLKEGAEGKAKIVLKAKGANLGPPPPPLVLPVTVQLARGDGGPCWQSTFANATKNAAGQFKARSD